MANRFIKPVTGNTVGLTEEQTNIGVDCKNARVVLKGIQQNDVGMISFYASYLWDNAARLNWESGGSVVPWRQEQHQFQGDDTGGRKDQAVAYLLSLPQFSGSFEEG